MKISSPRPQMQKSFPVLLSVVAAIVAFAGCGGGSSNKNVVAVVSLAPSSFSLVSGEVSTPLHASAVNSSGNPVATTFTFNSSNPSLVTISPSGLICAGIWDSTFVTCNGNDAQGNPLPPGQATVTATANGISSPPVTVAVHPRVTSIQFVPGSLITPGTCLSNGQTHTFVAHAFNNTTDITSQVGQINYTSTDFTIVSIDPNGLATAKGAGAAGIVASVGTTTSPAVFFKTCMPKTIRLHVQGDTPDNITTSATMNPTDTKVLQADWVDENGAPTNSAPVTFNTTDSAVVTLNGQTGVTSITAATPGGATIVASCSPPVCGNGIAQPVYSNPFTVNVTGTSPATSIWVASTDPATTSTIVPIDASKTPPAANAAVNLPGVPNSLVFAKNGLKAYMGTSGGLASLDPAASTVTTLDINTKGKVLAVSPDATKVIVSNADLEPVVANQRLVVFDSSNSTVQTFLKPGVVAAEFSSDGFKAFMAAKDGHIYVYSPFISLQTLTDAGSLHSVTTLTSGPLAYIANDTTVDAFAVCDNSPAGTLPVSAPSILLDRIPNSNQIVSVNATGLDIVTASVADAATGFCPQTASYTNQAIGFGPFTANQLLVPSNGSHIVVLPKGQPRVLVAIPGGGPGAINLASGTEALSGGLTLDGNSLWVGAAGSNDLHLINLLTSADTFQIQPNVNGNNAKPDIVAVRPK